MTFFEDLKSDAVGRLCVLFSTTFGFMAIMNAIGSYFGRPWGIVGAILGVGVGFWIGSRGYKTQPENFSQDHFTNEKNGL